jgi:hypothetical protein
VHASNSIPERGSKCDPFGTFAGSSANYRGHKERKSMKKEDDEQKEKDFQRQAR